MKISNKADYALHAMLYVAAVNGAHPSTIDQISHSENIPREYLAKVLKHLVQAGLLRSVKGIYGGYFLSKPRTQYNFLNILEAVDGPLSPALCTRPESERVGSHRKGKCPAYPYFEELRKKVAKELSSVNLDEISYEKSFQFAKRNNRERGALKSMNQ